MTRLSHVEINVSDYAKSVRFYESVLGALGWRKLGANRDFTSFTDGALKLILSPTEGRFTKFGFHRKRTGLNHLAFTVESKEAVDLFARDVLAPAGIACLYSGGPEGDDDYYAVYFEDPDRVKLEVVYAPHYCSGDHWSNQVTE